MPPDADAPPPAQPDLPEPPVSMIRVENTADGEKDDTRKVTGETESARSSDSADARHEHRKHCATTQDRSGGGLDRLAPRLCTCKWIGKKKRKKQSGATDTAQ